MAKYKNGPELSLNERLVKFYAGTFESIGDKWYHWRSRAKDYQAVIWTVYIIIFALIGVATFVSLGIVSGPTGIVAGAALWLCAICTTVLPIMFFMDILWDCQCPKCEKKEKLR